MSEIRLIRKWGFSLSITEIIFAVQSTSEELISYFKLFCTKHKPMPFFVLKPPHMTL